MQLAFIAYFVEYFNKSNDNLIARSVLSLTVSVTKTYLEVTMSRGEVG